MAEAGNFHTTKAPPNSHQLTSSPAQKNKARNTQSAIFRPNEKYAVRPMRRQVFETVGRDEPKSSLTASERARDHEGQEHRRDAVTQAAVTKSRNSISMVFSTEAAEQRRPLRTPASKIVNEIVRPATAIPRTQSEVDRNVQMHHAHDVAKDEANRHRMRNSVSSIFAGEALQQPKPTASSSSSTIPTAAAMHQRPLRTPRRPIEREKAPRTARSEEQLKQESAMYEQHVKSALETAQRARRQTGSTVFPVEATSAAAVANSGSSELQRSPGKKINGGRPATVRLDHEELRSDRTVAEKANDSERLRAYHDASAVARQLKARSNGSLVLGGEAVLDRPKTAPAPRRTAAADVAYEQNVLSKAMENHRVAAAQASVMKQRAWGSGNILSWE